MSMIQFKMRQIKVEQFAILSDIPLEKLKEMNLDTKMTVATADDIHSVSIDIRFVFRKDDMQIIILEVRSIFEVSENSWQELKINGQIKLPEDFLGHMALHTVGTARGILFCKTEGTPYASMILPQINVVELIQSGAKKVLN